MAQAAEEIKAGSGLAEVIAGVLADGNSPQQYNELTNAESGEYRVTLVRLESSGSIYVEIDGGAKVYRITVQEVDQDN